MTIAPWRWASSATAAGSGVSVNPDIVKFEGWTRRTARARPSASGASKSAARVRFVVPTSISFAPARRMMSGIRTPPPISTSSPRETTTPPRPGQPDGEGQRRRVVVRDERVLGAGQRDEVVLRDARPGPATTGRAVQLEEQVARREVRDRLDRGRRPGRPAEVGVDDDAGGVDHRRWGRDDRAGEAVEAVHDRRGERIEVGRRGAIALQPLALGIDHRRASPRAPAAASRGPSSRSRTRARTRSTLGGRGRSAGFDDIGPPSGAGLAWRERVGVEPTAPRRARRHRF